LLKEGDDQENRETRNQRKIKKNIYIMKTKTWETQKTENPRKTDRNKYFFYKEIHHTWNSFPYFLQALQNKCLESTSVLHHLKPWILSILTTKRDRESEMRGRGRGEWGGEERERENVKRN
jgi:hypothetical protein